MLAVPTVDQVPSMVAVLACTIASRKRKIRTPGVEQLAEVARARSSRPRCGWT